MSESKISLSSLLVPEKTVSMEFPGLEGFFVDICHVAREELAKERVNCIKKELNRKTRQMEDVLDEDKFLEVYIARVLKGWTGLKLRYLQELVVVNLSGHDPEEELPFSIEEAIMLMKNSSAFDEWLTEVVTDVQNFT